MEGVDKVRHDMLCYSESTSHDNTDLSSNYCIVSLYTNYTASVFYFSCDLWLPISL